MKVKISISCKAALLCLCVAMARPGLALPIEPVSLRTLILNSELVVLAKVEPEPRPIEKSDDGFILPSIISPNRSPARLRPLRVLKGKAPGDVLEVHFNANLTCPAPPHFREGKTVLTFLQPSDIYKGYTTVALSYGAITLNEEETGAYVDRVTELLEWERIYRGKVPEGAVVEWLVRCVEAPATKGEGAMELTSRREWLGTNTVASAFASRLTAQHLSRISNAVFNAQNFTLADVALLRLLPKEANPAIVRHLTDHLRKQTKPAAPQDQPDWSEYPWDTFEAMVLLAELLQNNDALMFTVELEQARVPMSDLLPGRLPGFMAIIDEASSKQANK